MKLTKSKKGLLKRNTGSDLSSSTC